MVNGQSGKATIYRVDGKSFVDLETLVRISKGSMAFEGDTIVLTLAGPQERTAAAAREQIKTDEPGLSGEFMKASLASVGMLTEWVRTLTYAAQQGVPGDGKRITILRDRAAEALAQAKVQASTNADRDAFQLIKNDYDTLKSWSDKLVGERRAMDTGKYSLSPELIDRDPTYQKIAACTKFLAGMLPSGKFEDDSSCH